MKISQREWIQLSSYLDGALNPKEMNLFEKRIQQNPELQSALKELQITKNVLKHAPQITVPRNFTLTHAMLGIKSRAPAGRGYRLVAAALSFLFIGVVVLDFGSQIAVGSFAPSAPKEMMLEAVSESAADSMEEPSLMAAGEETEMNRAPASTEADLPHEEGAPAAAAEAVEEAEMVGMAEEEEKSTDEFFSEPSSNLAEADGDVTSEDQALPTETITTADEEVLPTQAITTTIDESLPTLAQVPQPNVQVYDSEETLLDMERKPVVSTLRILEILFGFGAVAFAVAGGVKRRRNS
ncbi:MAG: hypothetical protein MUP11_07690 [Anaerolineales bacterium]|nr:hypothetical protein [Anaerolineales bacterium]